METVKKFNVLIAGCGYVGCELARQLLAIKNFNVWGLRRRPNNLPEGSIPISADLHDLSRLGEWPDKLDYVIYTAAPDHGTSEGYELTYLIGLRNILTRINHEQLSIKRIFFTSSTSVYHQNNHEWVNEQSLTQPITFRGKIMLEAEALLSQWELPTTVVRLGGIYGPGRDYLLRKVVKGDGCIKEPMVYSNRIHQMDCAGIITHLICQDIKNKQLHPLYLGVDHKPCSLQEIEKWLAKQLGIILQYQSPISQRGSKRCSNQKILDAGYHFFYPDYKTGYGELIKVLST